MNKTDRWTPGTIAFMVFLVILLAAVVFLIIWFASKSTMQFEKGKEVFFVKHTNKISDVFDNDEAAAFEKVFNSKLATFDQINHASSVGAMWPFGGWTLNGKSVYPSGLVGRCASFEMCDYLSRVCHQKMCAHIAYDQRTPAGLQVNVTAVGYLLYGVKPSQETVSKEYIVAPWNCKRGQWSYYDTALSTSLLQETYLVLPDGDDGQMEHASESMERVVKHLRDNGYEVRPATYSDVENAHGNGAQWCIGGWTADLKLVNPMQTQIRGCGGPGVSLNTYGVQGYLVYGVKPSSSMYGYHVVPFFIGRDEEKWSQYSK